MHLYFGLPMATDAHGNPSRSAGGYTRSAFRPPVDGRKKIDTGHANWFPVIWSTNSGLQLPRENGQEDTGSGWACLPDPNNSSADRGKLS